VTPKLKQATQKVMSSALSKHQPRLPPLCDVMQCANDSRHNVTKNRKEKKSTDEFGLLDAMDV